MATMMLMITTVKRVTPRNASCHESVLTLTMTSLKMNRTMMIIKAVRSLGFERNRCPKTAFKSRKVTLGIMEAIDRKDPHWI